jgi:hypothetical protein
MYHSSNTEWAFKCIRGLIMSNESNSLSLQIQETFLRNLIDLVPTDKRAHAMELAEQYKQLNRAVASVTPGSNRERYAGLQYAIDAIRLYLSDVGKPLTEEEIIEGVIISGFRPLTPGRTRGNLKKSLKQYLVGEAAKKNEIRRVGKLVGLYEWPEDKFKT